jgi:long-chain acyl-CoA synthetase
VDNALETLLDLARELPERPLLLTDGRSYTRAGFVGRAAALAGRLADAGLRRGDRVATLLEEYDNFFVAMVAAWLAGAVLVPLNKSLPLADLEWLVAKAAPRVLLTEDDGAAPEGPARLPAVAAELPEEPLSPSLTPVAPDELAMIMFTSGTTGVPKGVCHTLRAIGGNAGRVAGVLDLTPDDRIFVNTPPYFTSGICHFLTLLARGGSTMGRRGFFFGDGLLAEMAELGCTGFGGAPAHLVRVVEPLADDAAVPKRLRFWVSSGDHLALDTIARTRRLLPGVRLFNMYGLTEVGGRLCVLVPDELERRSGSVGHPLAGMTVTVRAADGAVVPDGEQGELYVEGPLVMRGYLDEPQITAASLTQHGFRTGDFGHRDADGFVWVAGRKDDIIKRGGEKVSIVHIHEALRALGLFADVAVIAVDDAILGHVPVAFVVPADGAAIKRTVVMRELRGLLPASSLPSRIVPVDEIPRTGSGKAVRSELLRLAAT